MPRKPRIEYAGAIYHVTSRGDHGEAIIRDDQDRIRFIKTVADVCERTGWLIHAYVLMNNHYHLLIETPEANLVAGMKWLQGTYTIRYNARHYTYGHLFQGRYKALIMNPAEDGYMRRVSTYIHLNPVRAGLVAANPDSLIKYQWSSYSLYLASKGSRPIWLKTDMVLASLGINPDGYTAQHKYADYIESLLSQMATGKNQELEDDWKEIRHSWCLGDSAFRKQIIEKLDFILKGHDIQSYSGTEIEGHGEVMAEQLLQAIFAKLQLSEQLLATMPKGHNIKRIIAWALRKKTIVSNRWLSDKLYLGHPANIPNYVRSVEQTKDGKLLSLRRQIESYLNPRTDP